jgi:hypothetical protein
MVKLPNFERQLCGQIIDLIVLVVDTQAGRRIRPYNWPPSAMKLGPGYNPDNDEDAELAERERQLYLQQALLLQQRASAGPSRSSGDHGNANSKEQLMGKNEVPSIAGYASVRSLTVRLSPNRLESTQMSAKNASSVSTEDKGDAEARWESVNWLLDELDIMKEKYGRLESNFQAKKSEVEALRLVGMDEKSLPEQVSDQDPKFSKLPFVACHCFKRQSVKKKTTKPHSR